MKGGTPAAVSFSGGKIGVFEASDAEIFSWFLFTGNRVGYLFFVPPLLVLKGIPMLEECVLMFSRGHIGLSFFVVELLQKAEGGTSPNHTPESYPESHPRIIPLKTYAARCYFCSTVCVV